MSDNTVNFNNNADNNTSGVSMTLTLLSIHAFLAYGQAGIPLR